MNSKNTKIIIVLIVSILILAGLIYYYFFLRGATPTSEFVPSETTGLFPSGGQGTPGGSTGITEITDDSENLPVPKYRKISQKPVSGGVIISTGNKEKGDKIRYVDRATGHIYETWTKSGEQVRISNTTIPKVYETSWNKSGDGFIARYLDENNEDITTYFAKLKEKENAKDLKGDLYELDGYFLQKNITDLSVSPAGKNIAYIIKKQGSSSVVNSEFNGKNGSEIFNSPLTEWAVEWFGNNFLLKTKPTYKTGGFVYRLDNYGTLTKILSDINGLTTLGKGDGSSLLYSESLNNSFGLYSYNMSSKEKTKLKLNTLPEKCVWSKKDSSVVYCAVPKTIPYGEYPDDWYQGIVSFDDIIWILDTKINLGSVVVDPERYSASSVDTINLMLNENEDYLIFTNKKDYSLWGIDMTSEPTEIIGD
ncbi:MAG: hypothetical protein WC849_02150 [Candidatus Paceibacterota bacterium]